MPHLPDVFLKSIENQFSATDFKDFQAAFDAVAPVSVRQNPSKTVADFPKKLDENWETTKIETVKWAQQAGFYLPNRPVFTLDPAFHAGAYYVQEASSMFLGEAIRQTFSPSESVFALDLCAAPGGKTTLIADVLRTFSTDFLLIGNEVMRPRYHILEENILKWGNLNVATANHDPKDFGALGSVFDLVVVDAPCSGEGMFRKDAKAIGEWSLQNVATCAARQRRILSEAVATLAENGLLMYSTCTFNDVENMENVAWLCENFDLESERLQLADFPEITEKMLGNAFGYQFYWHKTRGEGFFLSVFRKKNVGNKNPVFHKKPIFKLPKLGKKETELLRDWVENWENFSFFLKNNGQIVALQNKDLERAAMVGSLLKNTRFGVEIGTFKGTDFIPSHDFALSAALKRSDTGGGRFQELALDKTTALHYLKKENIETDAKTGWTLATFEGLPLGWLKVLPNRINNYLPKDFRIRMEID
ncbi:MAG: hypothetical protein RL757_1071 [Bacteroidota bacterium]|jgi:16S rRNA C967 or C1407 C5-methylase (RsmB/RsmF family)/NOL1/NOP2/fmu family ribosome biogenesis protein